MLCVSMCVCVDLCDRGYENLLRSVKVGGSVGAP